MNITKEFIFAVRTRDLTQSRPPKVGNTKRLNWAVHKPFSERNINLI